MSLTNLANFEVISLLPGLVTYVIVHLLVSRTRKIETVDAILVGLAYTLVVHGIWHLLKLPGSVFPTPDIVGTTLVAVILGLGLSICANHGWIYDALRYLRITNQPQWQSIWETAFRRSTVELENSWVILELKNGKRIMGYVFAFSGQREGGHVCISDPRWLNDSDGDDSDEQTPIGGWFLVDNSQIVSVHFQPKHERSTNDKRTDASTAASSTTDTAANANNS